MGNFDKDYIESLFITEGYFDKYIYEDQTSNAKSEIVSNRRKALTKSGTNYIYEFIMIPNDPFLNENQPLPPGVELQLSFDRLVSDFSVLRVDSGSANPLKGKVLELKNVYAQVEYISSTALRHYNDRINNTPIPYMYDECTVTYKALPLGDQSIRLENLKGGNTPDYVFIGIIPTSAISGSTDESAIKFKNYGIKEINLTLNGNSCHGYPIRVTNDYPIWPYFKFHDVLGKLQNTSLGAQQQIDQFKNNTLYAHKFEGEETSQGWIGVTINTVSAEGFEDPYTLGRYSRFVDFY